MRASLVVLVASLLLVARAARADDDGPPGPVAPVAAPIAPVAPVAAPVAPVAWDPAWRRFTVGEAIATGALGLGTGAFVVFGKDGAPNWRGPILFDKAVRDGLRGSSAGVRKTNQTIGDVTYFGGLAYPFLVDVLGAALVAHRSPEVAAQMALMDTEAFAITGFLSFLSNAVIRRERPYVRACGPGKPDPRFPDCAAAGQAESFFSGHTGIAFTGAALTCMHHANLPLYGSSRVAAIAVCAAMMAGATSTAVTRVIADKHYASDVLVGAGVGLASGLLVPAFHYRRARASPPVSAVRWLPVPMLSASTVGVGAVAVF